MAVNILGKLRKAFVGQDGLVDSADVEVDNTSLVGVLNGVLNLQTAINRVDGTGIGAEIFTFSGAYSAASANIDEWFGNKQLVRLRCTGRGSSPAGSLSFQLPGTTALNTAFDTLATLGVAERIEFVIEYTGTAESFINIVPRSSPSPQITGTTSIIVRSGVAASLEITRTSGTISNYVFTSIGQVAQPGTGAFDALKLQNPSQIVWDASANGPLPSANVQKGFAYKVVNAATDGSGRFGEVMYTDDWVVWEGDTFTSWVAEPHQWFVLSAHDVRRISALENDFLNNVQISPEGDRNAVLRGANYADTAGEIRMKVYATQADYSAADLNTTGQIDQYTAVSNTTGFLAIRLTGTLATLASTLPTLYVYGDIGGGDFVKIFNLASDFTHQGNFTTESDYLSNTTFNYAANEILRIYVGTLLDRYRVDNFDVTEEDLVTDVQRKLNRTDGNSNVDSQRLSTLESKMDGLFPLTPDVGDLTEFAGIYSPDTPTQQVDIRTGYSLIADYRTDLDRYESSGVTYDATGANVVRYTGLTENLHRVFGFKVTAPADQVLMWIVDNSTLIPFVDITSIGNIRVNNYRQETTQGQPVTNEIHFLTRTAGTEIITTASNSVSTFTVQPYPAGATVASRTMGAEIDIYVNGVDTLAGDLVQFDAPDTNEAQARTSLTKDVYLGPIHGNRTVRVTIGYEYRVSGSDLLIDFTLITAPSDVTVRMDSVVTYLSYTPASTTTRVDNFVVFQDFGSDYVFTGETDFIISFQPHAFDNATAVVAGAISATGTVSLFNDLVAPQPVHGFSSVEIPDTINFVTMLPDHFFRHNDIGALLPRRGTKWAYGLALLRTVSEHVINQEMDFSQGIVLHSPNGTRFLLTMNNDGTINIDTK